MWDALILGFVIRLLNPRNFQSPFPLPDEKITEFPEISRPIKFKMD